MPHKIINAFLAFLITLMLPPVMAQQGLISSGGEANGTTGNVSFSFGQVFFAIQTGPDGSAVQGLQQPYEISVITNTVEAEGIQLLVSAYPNPATDMLTLRIDGIALEHIPLLDISLFDFSGKQMFCKQAEGLETRIVMTHLAPGIYFLQVIGTDVSYGNRFIKTFKIIKNQKP